MFCWLVLDNPDLERRVPPALARALEGRLFPGARPWLRISPALPPEELCAEARGLPWLRLLSLASDDPRGRLLAEPLEHWEAEAASPALSRALGGHVSLGHLDSPPLAWAASWKQGRLVRALRRERGAVERYPGVRSKDPVEGREDVLRIGLEWALGDRLYLSPSEALLLPERLEAWLDRGQQVTL